jgi:hypothetical protein
LPCRNIRVFRQAHRATIRPPWLVVGFEKTGICDPRLCGGVAKERTRMLSVVIVMALVSIAASMFIRVGAFAVFAIFVACGFGVAQFLQGSSFVTAFLSTLAMLALMEIAYLVGLFLSGLWHRTSKLSKEAAATDNAPARGKHERG